MHPVQWAFGSLVPGLEEDVDDFLLYVRVLLCVLYRKSRDLQAVADFVRVIRKARIAAENGSVCAHISGQTLSGLYHRGRRAKGEPAAN